MKLCLPVTEINGLDSKISEHFGSAPYFMIVDTDTLDSKFIQNTNEHHSHGMCQPLSVLGEQKFDGIIVGGIGAGALNKLHAGNIKVYRTSANNITDVIKDYKDGSLSEVTIDSACAHHHGHNCGR